MAHKTKRRKYLDRSADILCKATYTLCRDSLKEAPRDGKPPDAKVIKDICSAVKDVITISNSMAEEDAGETGGIRITFEGGAEEYAE